MRLAAEYSLTVERSRFGRLPPSYRPHQQLRLAIPDGERESARQVLAGAQVRIGVMPTGSGQRSHYPSTASWELILSALTERFPGVRFVGQQPASFRFGPLRSDTLDGRLPRWEHALAWQTRPSEPRRASARPRLARGRAHRERGSGGGRAATFHVFFSADLPDTKPGDGLCETTRSRSSATVTLTPIMANPVTATLTKLADAAAAGIIRVPIMRTYGLEDVPQGLADFAAGTRGKLAVRIHND
jgi:hypothetical protein